MFRLFEWIYGASSFEQIDIIIWPVFERNATVRLFSDMGSHIFPTIKYYHT